MTGAALRGHQRIVLRYFCASPAPVSSAPRTCDQHQALKFRI
jgi:hypothetical protein